jgi:ketosteroid isomerase-like protein
MEQDTKTGMLPTIMLLISACWLTGASPAGSEQNQHPTVTLPASLARVLSDYEVAWQHRDANALADPFTEDGFVLSNGTPPVRGREQIARHYAGAGGPLVLRPLAFATDGSIGYIIGGFTRHKGDVDTGKFTLTLRRSFEGRWLITSDMDNGNTQR